MEAYSHRFYLAYCALDIEHLLEILVQQIFLNLILMYLNS